MEPQGGLCHRWAKGFPKYFEILFLAYFPKMEVGV
jgi:hypothetical protein